MWDLRSWLLPARRIVLGAMLAAGAGAPVGTDLRAATLPPGFAESVIPSGGTWTEALGLAFDKAGRMYVWERRGRVWIKDTNDFSFSLLLDMSEEVGGYNDLGLLGFALDPNFQTNGYIYLLYNVDRHHLLYFGTTNYDANADEYYDATIARLTRYTCSASDGFRSIDAGSRRVLIGETKETGFPICTDTQGSGSLVFGSDGTLLASCGDAASPFASDAGGPVVHSYAPQALADGIIRPKEDIGSFRAQLVDSLGGKIVRIDPATGNGVPSNPYYDAANPRSPRSRVWALGFRNPFRMTLRPDSGSDDPAAGNPGALYVGDVGLNLWESLDVITGPRRNFGWPLYEGMDLMPSFNISVSAFDFDATNALYPASGCNRYFSFIDLIKEDTTVAAGQPPFANPCNASAKIPNSIPQFLHARPVLDWNHRTAVTRTPIYDESGEAQTAQLGDPDSPVSGLPFKGNCSIGGTWYTNSNFPPQYQNTYFHADWGQGWIKSFVFDENNRPVEVHDFMSDAGLGALATIAANPANGSLYYIKFDRTASEIRSIAYVGNRTPVAIASADKYYGPGPLTVQFSSAGSSDPDNQPITYTWEFGDGSALSTEANPSHTFSAPAGVPTGFTVTLTATDSGGLSAQSTLVVSLNNTPPNVMITSPVDGSFYAPDQTLIVNLAATVTDAEFSESELVYRWQTLLHHNDHNHGSPFDTNRVTTTVLEPTQCEDVTIYYYRIILTVTDPAGLSTTREVRLFPDCGPNTRPTISEIANLAIYQDGSTGPIEFTIQDAEKIPDILQLEATTSNPSLVPSGNIVFGGSGSNRTVTVTPAAGQTGSAMIQVTVGDGPLSATDTFVLTVNPAQPGTRTFENLSHINIPDISPGAPYPAYIRVSGMGGTLTRTILTLNSLSHTWTPDIDVLLVGPSGQGVIAFSDVGRGLADGVTITLSDAAASSLPLTALVSGTYKPTDYEQGDSFPAPAPAGPYARTLSAFNGASANGNWALYTLDDGVGDQGSIDGGWSLTLTTADAGGTPPSISTIPNQLTTTNTPTARIAFTIGDAETPVSNLVLSGGSSDSLLVPAANIVFGGSGSNRTVTVTPAAGQTGSAIITITVRDGGGAIATAGFLITIPAGTRPTISTISDQTTDEDTSTPAISFTIGDTDTAVEILTVSGTSSNPALVPNGNITVGGSGADRTVFLRPARDQTGTATITLTVSDGQSSASTTFLFTVGAVNDPPTISAVANQTVEQDSSTGPIAFNVADVDTASSNLTVSASSSNQELVPNAGIALEGSGSNRTVILHPTTGETGITTITLTVSDGSLSTNTSFTLTVTIPNAPPTISSIADQTINEDTSTDFLNFTVGDVESDPATLVVTATSSNPALVPLNKIVLGGTGANRTIKLSPATNQNGSATITLSVSDGNKTVTNTFALVVSPVNDPPTISNIATQSVAGGTSTGPIAFTVADLESASSSLTVEASSSNQLLVSDENIVLGGSGANRTISVTPKPGTAGTVIVTVAVSDGALSNSTSFTLLVNSLTTRTVAYTNTTVITIPDVGAASPYPSTINISGVSGNISNLTVTLMNLSHTWSRDLDVLLVGPAGGQVLLFSDAGSGPVNNLTLTFSDSAASALPDTPLTSGTYKPADYPPADTFPAPAPSGPYAGVLSTFNGLSANGAWSLYVVDDGSGDLGAINGGWSLALTIAVRGAPPTISNFADQSTMVNTATGPIAFTIDDPDTAVTNLTLTASSSNPTLAPNTNLFFGGSGGNRTITVTPATGQTGSVNITLTVTDEAGLAASAEFVVTVTNTPPTAWDVSFTNSTAITIPDSGAASPYPSTISISGVSGEISNVTVTVINLNHTWTRDLDVLLVGPGGGQVLLFSDAGDGPVNNLTLTFSDSAASALPDTSLSSGTYKPADYPPADTFPAPAPVGPYAVVLSTFNGLSANGLWSLYVLDDGTGDLGSISGGWSLAVSTVARAVAPAPILRISRDQTTVWISFESVSGKTYVVEYKDALSDAVWTTFSSVAGTDAAVTLSDAISATHNRFYRIRVP